MLHFVTLFTNIAHAHVITYGRYFDFDALNEKQTNLENWVLFFIVSFLVFIWMKLFLHYDKH
jgi:tryptophan 2,3-dioxygenase